MNHLKIIKELLQTLENKVCKDVKGLDELTLRGSFTEIDNQLKYIEDNENTYNTPFAIPKGYLWCEECKALTPHFKGTYSKSCVICGDSKYSDQNCPNCGWEEPEDQKPLQHEVIIHGSGCHCNCEWMFDADDYDSFRSCYSHAEDILKDFLSQYKDLSYMRPDPIKAKIKKILEDKNMLECSCPRVIVYPITNIYNYSSGYIWSDSCSNAMEWTYDVRCPICGEIFNVSDTNC